MSAEHARDLGRFAKQLTHVVCTGVNGRYDQVTMVEADTLEEINAAATAFRMGNKARYIEIVDIVVGMKARHAAWPTGPASPADVRRPVCPPLGCAGRVLSGSTRRLPGWPLPPTCSPRARCRCCAGCSATTPSAVSSRT
ncbi:hypothetical protein NKG94_48520 [Micromonospora sp. M12]